MDDLVRWLGEQLSIDAEAAEAAADGDSGAWSVGEKWNVYRAEDETPHDDAETNRLVIYGNVHPQSEHIAEWDPARVLREIEAKRRIIQMHEITVEKTRVPPFDPYTGERNPDEYEVTCAICGWVADDPTSGCLTLRALALPYADRPGYLEEWKP